MNRVRNSLFCTAFALVAMIVSFWWGNVFAAIVWLVITAMMAIGLHHAYRKSRPAQTLP